MIELFEFCFAVGTLWALVSLLLGGMHVGHLHHGHFHPAHPRHLDLRHGPAQSSASKLLGADLLNPSVAAVFLAWFGGVGYLLLRHSGWLLWINLALSVMAGLGGALLLAAFLRFLQKRDKPLDPLDYEMVGVLGRVTANIRPDGVGEVQFVREGARRAVPARSDDGTLIPHGQEVIVTRYERGVAHVRTWEAMTR